MKIYEWNNKKLISYFNERGFQGNIIAYMNINTEIIYSATSYDNMIEREIKEMWDNNDDIQAMYEYRYENYRKNELKDCTDTDFLPLIELTDDNE